MKIASVVVLLGVLSAAPMPGGESLWLVGATVYDGTGGPPLAEAVIRVKDDRIACIGGIDDCPVPEEARRLDLQGQFITPGLVDAHVHFAQTGWFDGRPDSRIGRAFYDFEELQRSLRARAGRWHRTFLCAGVTAVYDMGGLPWTLDLAALAEDHPARVHVRAAGPLITHADSIMPLFQALESGAFLPMGSDAEAVASVRALAEMGAGAVKVWYLAPAPEIREEMDARLRLIGREARALGLPLVVHATERREARVALEAGARMLVHSVGDQALDEAFLALTRDSGAYYVPTLRVAQNWARARASVALGTPPEIDDPNGCIGPRTRRVIRDVDRLQASLPENERTLDRVLGHLARAAERRAVMDANLRRVHAAGIPIATGTDAGNPLTFHGPAIYQEMEAMERAGIPADEVLVMSTRNGAAAMGRLEDFGTLEAGKLADLVVLEEDPGTSTAAYRSITRVMRAGVLQEVGWLDAKQMATF
ncbi:amidohydrolase family protein [Halomonas beimenensis]|uniref:Amidohydrolase-related domain-containing protein n=1 Tax=Halomonas beimenensis TaxID=475662 RepID=A0A291PAZ5_9GAMM|nr:amidohydrolase family protein [Halomonas beimenensis]ATJ84067.1 hypothetical protein BEI_3080 [Halomonas beimenensis]